MHARIFMLAAMLAADIAQAAEEFGETMPTEIVRIFMGLEALDGNVYTDIPVDFPSFVLPQGMTAIGSVERREGYQSVYLRTSLDVAEASGAVRQALQGNGWRELEYPGTRNDPPAGFMADGIASIPSMLCHDEQGSLSISSQRSGQSTVVVLSRVNVMLDPRQTCSEMISEREQQIARRRSFFENPLIAELPRLELPPEGSIGRPSGSTGGISSNSDEVRASTSMQIAWDVAAVLEHFAAQIDAQGWTPQGQWDTPLAAGGAWIRTTQAGDGLLGLLSVIRKTEGDYLLEFRIIPTPGSGG